MPCFLVTGMPGLIASSRPATTNNSEWTFNLRDSLCFHDAYNNSDAETEARPTAKTQTQLLEELDLSARKDTAIYKPNPWTIAKENAACRSNSNSTSTFACRRFSCIIGTAETEKELQSTTFPSRHASHNFAQYKPSANKNIFKKTIPVGQSTLNTVFTVEKARLSNSKPSHYSNPRKDVTETDPSQFDADYKIAPTHAFAVSKTPSMHDKLSKASDTYQVPSPISDINIIDNNDAISTLPRANSPGPYLSVTSLPKTREKSLNLNRSSFSNSNSKDNAKHPMFTKSALNLNIAPKRKRKYVDSDDEDDEDAYWTTLPSKVKKRFKPAVNSLPKAANVLKRSGKFMLPISSQVHASSILSSKSSQTSDEPIVEAIGVKKLSDGKTLTFYKPPAKQTFRVEDQPVILRVRKAVIDDIVS